MTETESVYRRDIPEMLPSTNHSYFHLPPAWVGTPPSDDELAHPTNDLIKIVASKLLSSGIKIDAYRDGVFVFDFTGWPDGRPIPIPAHTIEGGKKRPAQVTKAEKEAAEHLNKCMSAMNAHLACMSTGMARVQGHSLWIRQIVTPSSYFTTHWVNGQRWLKGISGHYDPMLAYVSANYRLEDDIQKRRGRTAIRLETFEYACDLLERIVTSEVPDMLQLTNLIYFAAINYAQHDFPMALTLAWAVCEKLLRVVWDDYITKNSSLKEEDGKVTTIINSDRKKNLLGPDFTASVISEVLALAGPLKHETYVKLSNARKARKHWLHNLTPISTTAASACIQIAELFLKEVSGIELLAEFSYSTRH